jgi:hypothetical protein
MTRLELQIKIKALRDELEDRHSGIFKKSSDSDDKSLVSSATLQNELYKLIYRLSKVE